MPKSLFSVQPLRHDFPTNKSIEAYQSFAKRESAILRRNGRIPKHRLTLEFWQEYSPNDITSLRTKIFRYLKEHGIEAIARIGLSWRWNQRNRYSNKFVHFHVITDLRWYAKDLQIHFHRACQEQGLVLCKDYWIDYSPVMMAWHISMPSQDTVTKCCSFAKTCEFKGSTQSVNGIESPKQCYGKKR